MKQELICLDCAAKYKKKVPRPDVYPGEHVQLTKGICDGVYICDSCNRDLLPGDEIAARAFMMLDRNDPNDTWYEEYISNTENMYQS